MKILQTEIVRSYSRTVQIAQYEPASFFSSHKAVIEGELSQKQSEEISERLYQESKLDVEVEVAKFKKPDLIIRAKVKDYLDSHNFIS